MSLRHGLVVGKFYPPHAGHHYLIGVAAERSDRVTVVVMAAAAEAIALEDRVRWLRASHAGDPRIRIVGITDNVVVDYQDPAVWDAHMALIEAAIERAVALDGAPAEVAVIGTVFSSEPYGEELARRLRAEHVLVDATRAAVAISATALRADPVANWHYLDRPARTDLALRVVVLGAESTGTTTTSQALAERLRDRDGPWAETGWVPEFGRTLTARRLGAAGAQAVHLGRPPATMERLLWAPEDFTDIAERQVLLEDQAAGGGSPVLICDTDAFATGIWHERYLGTRHAGVEAIGDSRAHPLYLLTSHGGVPFEWDEIRDGEELRPWMTDLFMRRMNETGRRFIRLEGTVAQRVATAMEAIDSLVDSGWSFSGRSPGPLTLAA